MHIKIKICMVQVPQPDCFPHTILKRFGSDAFQGRYEYRLNNYLNQQVSLIHII